MKIGILGTGEVGQSLGTAFVSLGHDVLLAGREASNEKALRWAKQTGNQASVGTFSDAAAFGELVVLATLGVANEAALRAAGPDTLAGKIVIDTTNPLDFSKGMPPTLAIGHDDSGGEQVQRILPDAHVVKAFNTVGSAHMFRPNFPGGPPDMFICGNDAAAKGRVSELLSSFGWGTLDIGGIQGSRYLEPMCLVWVLCGIHTGSFDHAFKLLKR